MNSSIISDIYTPQELIEKSNAKDYITYRNFKIKNNTDNATTNNRLSVDSIYCLIVEMINDCCCFRLVSDDETDKLRESLNLIPVATLRLILDNMLQLNSVREAVCNYRFDDFRTNQQYYDEAYLAFYVGEVFLSIQSRLQYNNKYQNKDGSEKEQSLYDIMKFMVGCQFLIVNHPNFSGVILGTALQKCLELAVEKGYVPAFLTIACLFPEWINDDYYPLINKSSDVYKRTDWGRLEIDETFHPLLTKYRKYV